MHKICQTCQWWEKTPRPLPKWTADWAECTLDNGMISANTDFVLAHLDTNAKFGCNQWQKKVDGKA